MSRRSKRTRGFVPSYVIPDFGDSNSEDDSDSFQLLHTAIKNFTKRVKRRNVIKKTPATKKTVAKRPPLEVVYLDSDSHENDLSPALKDNHEKNIQTKVDSFFKSSHLLSDDDDDEPPTTKPQTVEKSTVSKEFYVLSDSDDEIPSTSVTKTTTSYSWSTTNVCKPTNVNKEDEIMELVDTILESNDTEINLEPDSWNEIKSKTDEILGSVNEILGSMTDDIQKKKVDLVAEKTDNDRLSCPICLEDLGKNRVPGATVCGHIFCMECIKQVAKSSKSCPTCRKRITLKQIHPLYL